MFCICGEDESEAVVFALDLCICIDENRGYWIRFNGHGGYM